MNDTTNTRKVRTALSLDAATLQEWITSYNNTQRLPSKDIPCSQCGLGITATHGNLHNKVKQAGGIRELLTGFVCKSCTASNTPKVVRAPKTPRIRKSTVEKETTTRPIPQVSYNPTRYTIQEIAASAELTREFTQDVCLHPQRFLNDGGCDNCPLYTNCAANCKTLSRARQRELARAK